MMTTTQRNAEKILSFFTGKTQEKVGKAIALLIDSEVQGYWVKGVSRSVRAGLGSKPNAFNKAARAAAHDLYETAETKEERDAWFKVYMVMTYGGGQAAEAIPACRHLLTMESSKVKVMSHIVEKALAFADVTAPLFASMNALDIRRPIPKVAFGTLSKTVVTTFTDLDFNTLRQPEIVYEYRTIMTKTGLVTVPVGRIIWPEGTKHETSRFCGDSQCHACGHRISNPSNWVPFVVDGKDGAPRSFWVGRDCAKNMLGATVEGEAIYEER